MLRLFAQASRLERSENGVERMTLGKLGGRYMSSQMLNPNREAAIWARLMQAHGDELSPQVAEYLRSIRFGESDRHRMEQLPERSESGILTDEERAEFDSYLRVGNLLAAMQSKASLALRLSPRTGPVREPGPRPAGPAASAGSL
jgi:hypothetical protein